MARNEEAGASRIPFMHLFLMGREGGKPAVLTVAVSTRCAEGILRDSVACLLSCLGTHSFSEGGCGVGSGGSG